MTEKWGGREKKNEKRNHHCNISRYCRLHVKHGRLRIDLPGGIEFDIAGIGGARSTITSPIAFTLKDTYGQFNGPAPHMLDIKWVPIVGACVLTRKVWESLSPLGRDELMRAAQQAGASIRQHARDEDTESIEAMKRRGLQVAIPTAEVDAEWRRVVEQAYPGIRGSLVPAETFDEVMALLRDYRGAHQ